MMLETFFVTKQEFSRIREYTAEEAGSGMDCALPYFYRNHHGQMIGRGFGDSLEAVVLEIISDDPADRIKQMRDAGRQCSACSSHDITHEVEYIASQDEDGQRTAILHVCASCYGKIRAQESEAVSVGYSIPDKSIVLNAQNPSRKKRRAMKKKLGTSYKPVSRKEIKAKRKAQRQSRKRGRRK